MNVWQWFKNLSIWATLGGIVSAILLALAASRARENRRKAERLENKAHEVLSENTSKSIQKGKALTEKANKAKDRAVKARAKAEERLNELGEKNEDLDAIADRFNSRRLRK